MWMLLVNWLAATDVRDMNRDSGMEGANKSTACSTAVVALVRRVLRPFSR